MALAEALPNVYVDTSNSTCPWEIQRRGLTEKSAVCIVLGSDFPLIGPAAMAGAVLDVLEDRARQQAILMGSGSDVRQIAASLERRKDRVEKRVCAALGGGPPSRPGIFCPLT